MLKFVINRLIQGLVAIFVVTVVIFLLMRIAPGDVALLIISQGIESVTREDVDPLVLARVEAKLGIDRPIYVQYRDWLWDTITLDWGSGFYASKPIMEEFVSRAPVTFLLGLYSVLISIVIGIPVGIIMALKQDTWMDYVARVFSLAGLSMPNFWIATVVIAMGVYFFAWSPRLEYAHPWDDLKANMAMLFWPAFIGGLASGATKARMMRSTMLEVLRQDYIRTAHSKGLRYMVVVYRHALKNALLPVVTIIGLTVAVVAGGSVIMETIFQLPGIGVYLVRGMNQRDFPVVQNMVVIISAWIIVVNVITDMTYGWLDPRIKI
jgi:peptide/nickel transport system permease protein